MGTTGPTATTSIRLQRRTGWQPIDLAELWRYRELMWFLAMRDIKVRYKQTALGALWAIIQPVTTMVVFSVLYRLMGTNPTGGKTEVVIFTALLPWQLFANILDRSGNSLISNQNLITKIYFPRLIMPLSTAISALVDFAVAFVVL